jgi:hypothetical protein
MILVECHNDQELMYRMGFRPDQVEHEFGRSKVLARMMDVQKAVGIIDEDPHAGAPEYLREVYAERNTEGKIRLLVEKRNDEKMIIEISPCLEDWLYEVAGRNHVLPERFGLPAGPKKLHLMSLRSGRNMQNFQRFLDALRKTGDDEINTLREWIREAIAE